MEYLGFKSKRANTNTVPVPSSDDDVSGGMELHGRGGRHRQEEQRMSKHKMKQLNKQQRKVKIKC